MRLNAKMISIYEKALNRYPGDGDGKIVMDYFKEHESRYGVHASQLARKHHLALATAVKASAMLNDWLDQLKGLEKRLPPKLWNRLYWCAKSYCTTSNMIRTCESKLCPWCRAILVMRLEGYLASSQACGYTQTTTPVVEPLRSPRTPANVVMSLRRIVNNAGNPVLQVVHLYRFSPTKELTPVTSHTVQDLVGYDFRVLRPNNLDTWLRLTSRLDLWTRESVKHRCRNGNSIDVFNPSYTSGISPRKSRPPPASDGLCFGKLQET